jgi:DNA polymerase-4
MDRTILHCDANGFFASVECLYRPELKDVPMAVSGNVEDRHGIILAKTELDNSFVIKTAETVWQAKKKCPGLVLVPPHHERYRKYSKIINDIYERLTDMVEPFGIDESWLDVTGSMHLFGSGREIADSIRETVKSEVGLTVSVGVSFNKTFAKLGSDLKKPDATTVISRENYKEVVYPLPVSSLLFAGKSATKALEQLGITTIGKLASFDKTAITQKLGKMGAMLYDYANGTDDSPVHAAGERREAKSIGNGMTFRRDLAGMDDINSGVLALADTVATRLRKHGLKCCAVQVMIRDPQFRTISRQKKLAKPTHLSKDISAATLEIIKASWDISSPIRMLTITGMSLCTGDSGQLSFFDKEADGDKQERIERAIDGIRGKYGSSAISVGTNINSDIGAVMRKPDNEEQ